MNLTPFNPYKILRSFFSDPGDLGNSTERPQSYIPDLTASLWRRVDQMRQLVTGTNHVSSSENPVSDVKSKTAVTPSLFPQSQARKNDPEAFTRLGLFPSLKNHPQWEDLLLVVTGESHLSPAGYPQISESSFKLFNQNVPHLFQNGASTLDWLKELRRVLEQELGLTEEQYQSIDRSIKVIQQMILSANVTAPSDLWLMHQLATCHQETGLVQTLLLEGSKTAAELAQSLNLDQSLLIHDLEFLYSRGILEKTNQGYSITSRPSGLILKEATTLPDFFKQDIAKVIQRSWQGDQFSQSLTKDFFNYCLQESSSPTSNWQACPADTLIGYGIVPLVIALKASVFLENLKVGQTLSSEIYTKEMLALFEKAGYMKEKKLTSLGVRVLQKGSGPFGIIYTYYPYLNIHKERLTKEEGLPHVERVGNIVASRLANEQAFTKAIEAIESIVTAKRPPVVIEHALGLGVGLQKFVDRYTESEIQFVGADYEQSALDKSKERALQGELPKNIILIQADIGNPEQFLDRLADLHINPLRSIMIVGNGFHEARGKTDKEMIEVFRTYRQAGINLVFTEETALHSKQILDSAWNTYHAGFRWVHEVSGQRLRPIANSDSTEPQRLSWMALLEKAGYKIRFDLSHGTRRIKPFPLNDLAANPHISYTYIAQA